MAASSYDEAIRRVLAHEGGYVNHPSDPGGETNFGITIATARAHGYSGKMRSLPLGTAKAIYRRAYWDAVRGDELPAGVDYAVFDYAVNSGVGRARKVLRAVCSIPASTAPLTEGVLAAARQRPPKALVEAICDERLAFLKRLKTWPTFGKGWGRRVAEVRAVGTTLAAKQVLEPPVKEKAQGKGVVPVSEVGQKGTAGGAVVIGAEAARQAAQAGYDWTAIVAVLAVTGIAAVLLWVFWRWRAERQQERVIGVVPVPTKGSASK